MFLVIFLSVLLCFGRYVKYNAAVIPSVSAVDSFGGILLTSGYGVEVVFHKVREISLIATQAFQIPGLLFCKCFFSDYVSPRYTIILIPFPHSLADVCLILACMVVIYFLYKTS